MGSHLEKSTHSRLNYNSGPTDQDSQPASHAPTARPWAATIGSFYSPVGPISFRYCCRLRHCRFRYCSCAQTSVRWEKTGDNIAGLITQQYQSRPLFPGLTKAAQCLCSVMIKHSLETLTAIALQAVKDFAYRCKRVVQFRVDANLRHHELASNQARIVVLGGVFRYHKKPSQIDSQERL